MLFSYDFFYMIEYVHIDASYFFDNTEFIRNFTKYFNYTKIFYKKHRLSQLCGCIQSCQKIGKKKTRNSQFLSII